MPILSVVVPVHNGEKRIKKTINNIRSQNLKDLEIILVENNSTDNSAAICKKFGEEDPRIKVIISSEKGTSLARKAGVLAASGTYITFCDQDDEYINQDALGNMVRQIEADQSDICQFGQYIRYNGLYKKVRMPDVGEGIIYQKDEFMKRQIRGVLGFGWSNQIYFTPSVWTKIYKSCLLQDAVKDMQYSLYFGEDMYLNICAFFNKNAHSFSIHKEPYYVWSSGVGFSASRGSSLVLLQDFQYITDISVKKIIENNCGEALLIANYWDKLNVYRWTIYSFLYDKLDDAKIVESIEMIEQYAYIQQAKRYLGNVDKEEIKFIPDHDFLLSDYTALEYLEWCKKTLPKRTKKAVIISVIKKVWAYLAHWLGQ